MKYILRLPCTIVIWSSGTSAADLMYPNVIESRSEKNGYWRSQKDFLQVDVPDSMALWWSILGKHGLNICSVKGFCNSKVCTLWCRGKFAEVLLKCRPHKQGCFQLILQGPECLHGQVMGFFLISWCTSKQRRTSAFVQKFFTQWPIFPFWIKHAASLHESYPVHYSWNSIKPRKYP